MKPVKELILILCRGPSGGNGTCVKSMFSIIYTCLLNWECFCHNILLLSCAANVF